MGRKPRIEYPGGVYHLIQRGNNREFIFTKDEDKEFLLDLLKKYKEVMGFELFGYVIMGNHYHIMIRIGNTPLPNIMHRINNRFSRYYNIKNKRTGHVFENRYKGILVIEDRYLLSLLRYIHQNPVHANMCANVSDYIWSSDRYYRENINGFINIDYILSLISVSRKRAINKYIEFMNEEKSEDVLFFEEVSVIGRVSTKRIDDYLRSNIKSLDQILRDVAGSEQIYNELKQGCRKRYLSSYKREFIEAALKSNYTYKEIGGSIRISDAAVYRIINNI